MHTTTIMLLKDKLYLACMLYDVTCWHPAHAYTPVHLKKNTEMRSVFNLFLFFMDTL